MGPYVSGYLSLHFAMGILQGAPSKTCHSDKALVEFPVMGWCTLVRKGLAETVRCCRWLSWYHLAEMLKVRCTAVAEMPVSRGADGETLGSGLALKPNSDTVLTKVT